MNRRDVAGRSVVSVSLWLAVLTLTCSAQAAQEPAAAPAVPPPPSTEAQATSAGEVKPAQSSEVQTQPPVSRRPKVCLVLSGGGARGVAHVGVLKVLEELRVPIDCVVGTSMGSIIGGGYAYGYSPAQLEKEVRSIDWANVLSDEPPRAERSVRSKQLDRAHLAAGELGMTGTEIELPKGAIIGQQLDMFLQHLVGPNIQVTTFDAMPIPFRALATNIGDGSLVEIKSGSLPTALRASMSVPGVFAPIEYDGVPLVDGGLVRNLGVDVARRMDADVVIAVNLGTGLMKPEEIRSVFGVGSQVINILTEQNVRISLTELTPSDILIVPELGDYSSADFVGSAKTIKIGEDAAWKVADKLRALSVPEAEFQDYLARVRKPHETMQYANVRLDTTRLSHANPKIMEATFEQATDGQLDDRGIARGQKELLATDDLQQVRYELTEDGGTRQLTVEPVEKTWGPNYLHFGLSLSTDMKGESAFTLSADHRMTWLTQSGTEWRNTVTLGNLGSITSELYQPLDDTRHWFVAPRAVLLQQLENLFAGDEPIAQYRNRRATLGFDIGRRFGTVGEARIRYAYGANGFHQATGLGTQPPIDDHIGDLGVLMTLDQFNNWNFPWKGYYLDLSVRATRDSLGADLDYNSGSLTFEQAFGNEINRFRASAFYNTSFGGDRPIYDAFSLGGAFRLSGFAERELLTNEQALARVIYERRLVAFPAVAHGFYVGASLEAAGIDERLNGPEDNGVIWSGSIFAAADTFLGPFYFGVGLGEAGNNALYLFLGRP